MRASFPSREARLAEARPTSHAPANGSVQRIHARSSTSFNAAFRSDAPSSKDARKACAWGNNVDIGSWHVQTRRTRTLCTRLHALVPSATGSTSSRRLPPPQPRTPACMHPSSSPDRPTLTARAGGHIISIRFYSWTTFFVSFYGRLYGR